MQFEFNNLKYTIYKKLLEKMLKQNLINSEELKKIDALNREKLNIK